MEGNLLKKFVGSELTLVHPAWLYVGASLALSLLGMYAIDLGQNVSEGLNFSGLVARQGVYLLVAIVVGVLACVPHYRVVRVFAWPLLAAVLALLVFLLIPWIPASIVRPRNGARAWIEMGAFDFQPSELAKIAVVIALAEYLRYRSNQRTWLGLIAPAAIVGVPVLLILKQPDLGMAVLFIPALGAMLLVAGARIKHLAMVVVLGLALAVPAYPLLRPHQKARIEGLIRMVQSSGQPGGIERVAGADDINFQSVRSQTLAGAGQMAGVSDGKTRVLHKFNALPERHNDMILSVILTRFGFFGALVVFGLYAVWFVGAYLSAALCKDGFGQLVIVGFTAILFTQTFINASMALGLLPIIGVPLPFVSYGGTSLVTSWLMTGLVVSVAMRRSSRLSRPTFEFDDTPYDPVKYGARRNEGGVAPVMMGRSR